MGWRSARRTTHPPRAASPDTLWNRRLGTLARRLRCKSQCPSRRKRSGRGSPLRRSKLRLPRDVGRCTCSSHPLRRSSDPPRIARPRSRNSRRCIDRPDRLCTPRRGSGRSHCPCTTRRADRWAVRLHRPTDPRHPCSTRRSHRPTDARHPCSTRRSRRPTDPRRHPWSTSLPIRHRIRARRPRRIELRAPPTKVEESSRLPKRTARHGSAQPIAITRRA
jgi:hypothetical protein